MPVPLPNVAGAYLAQVHGTANGLPMNNLLAWGVTPNPATGTADVDAAQAIADQIAVYWPALATSVLHNAYRGDLVTCYPLHTPTHPAVFAPMTAAGGLSGTIAPAPLAIVVKHSVVRRGRGSQGRNFLSFFSDGAISTDGKSIDDGYRDSVTADWATFISAVETAVSTAVGATAFFGQLSKVGAGHLYTVSASAAESLLSTQRSRAAR